MTVPVMPGEAGSAGHERDAHATFELARLRRDLKPFKLHWFATVGSTNVQAAKMRRERRLLAPGVVLTGRQTAGRGRGSNVWHSPPGVITATFVLPAHDTLPPQHVPLLAGLAVRDAIAELGIDGVGIKWPNDLWYSGVKGNDRKLAGLLCERIDSVDLIGVGVNANVERSALPTELRKTSTSLREILGRPVDQTALVAAISKNLWQSLTDARSSLAAIHTRLLSLDVLRGRKVRVAQPGEPILDGVADGIDPHGRLVIRIAGKRHAIVSATVRILAI